MTLPTFERVLFKKTPIRLALAQIRYPLLARFGESSFHAPFFEAIKSEYPKPSREKQTEYNISPHGIQSTTAATLWRYSSRDKLWAVVLGEEAVTLEVRGYSSIEDFTERFSIVLKAVCQHLGVTERARLGMRYINEVRHPDGINLKAWLRLIKPELVGLMAHEIVDGACNHLFQEMVIQRDDGVLAIRHGLLKGSVVDPPPSNPPADGRFYLLDYDYFDATDCALNIDEISERLHGYNDTMYRLFRWTLQEELFNYLEPNHAS